MIRSVIIDDEFLARDRLKNLLKEHEDIVIIGEAKNGSDGISLIEEMEPELIFLDIEMPDLDGFSVLSGSSIKPFVVFTTAYSDYAIKAFEVQAIDYLLKPFDEDRLGACLQRVRENIDVHKSARLGTQMAQLLKTSFINDSIYRTSFIIKENGYEIEILVDSIQLMEADGNYVRLVTSEKTYLYRISMNTLEADLNPSHFTRIHRAIIVNNHSVQTHKYIGNNEFRFMMKNGLEVTSSRSFKKSVKTSFPKLNS